MTWQRIDPVVRFWAKFERAAGGCWLWTAGVDKDGYGLFTPEHHHQVRAHRYSYELIVGPIAEDLVIDHLCRTPRCVNPVHLEPVTNRENLIRGTGFVAENVAKTHCPKGHPFDERNTFFARGSSSRRCRECHRQSARETMRKRREAAR